MERTIKMTGPREKRERALGEHLHLKAERCASPKCALIRKPYRPGVHGKKRTRAVSDFGRQLREKQKFKLSYGVNERTLRGLFERARQRTGSTAAGLLELLERRLDNVVYRLGFAGSRASARQYIVHGHLEVNGMRVRSPGYEVRADDAISIRKASTGHAAFRGIRERLERHDVPPWLGLDAVKLEGRVKAVPQELEPPFEISLVVESFSK